VNRIAIAAGVVGVGRGLAPPIEVGYLSPANIWSRHEMKWGHVVREKLVMLLLRFVLFARNVGRNRESVNNCEPRPKFEWPFVMNSFIAMHRPPVSATWIWLHQHARWHHGNYRTRR
jgi:hypothetical protein